MHFHNSDDSAKPPPACPCHNQPKGSCESVKSYHVERIHRGITISGFAPNMDGLHESLKFPCPIEVWKWALASYFDADEISQGLEFGWGVSITKQPRHKDVKWNLQGASLFQSDVQHYIDKELQFGALMGPFELFSLPFDVLCSPLNTVRKKNGLY